MAFIFQPQLTPTIAVADSNDRIPVRRIFCIGRNYASHAREMGNDPDREPPFFFLKPADSVVDDNATIPYPLQTKNLHFEAELVVVIGVSGGQISEANSLSHVWGYAVGNDLTRRDLQLTAKALSRPWDIGKGFDRSAPISAAHPVSKVGHLNKGTIKLTVNGEIKQNADLSELIWSIPELISILSHSMELKAGDIIMTGTPAGVGPLVAGDTCIAEIQGLGSCTTHIG